MQTCRTRPHRDTEGRWQRRTSKGGGRRGISLHLPSPPSSWRPVLVLGGGGWCGNHRTSFPFLSRFLGSPSLPSFCLKQIKMAELSSLEEEMEVLMEVWLSLPHSHAGRTHSRNSISCCERRQKNHGISFPPTAATPRSAARLSSQAPSPSPPGRPGGERGRGGRTAARVSPCDPVRGSENSELFLLLQSG